MAKKRKLFVFDLDGTLLNSQSQVSEQNLKALAAAKAKNHLLVMATGRNYPFSQLVMKDHWHLFDYYLGCNAAIMHDIKGKQFWQASKNISYSLVDYLVSRLEKIGGGLHISTIWNVYSKLFLIYENQTFINHINKDLFEGWEAPELMSEKEKANIIQVSIHVDPELITNIAKQIKDHFGSKYAVTITSTTNIDINLHRVNKLFGIKEIARIEQINDQSVFVFGDTQNDIAGLEYYKNSYAMENSLNETKLAAKNTIGSNDADAIAKVILKNI